MEQTTNKMSEYLSINEASEWASEYLDFNSLIGNYTIVEIGYL